MNKDQAYFLKISTQWDVLWYYYRDVNDGFHYFLMKWFVP